MRESNFVMGDGISPREGDVLSYNNGEFFYKLLKIIYQVEDNYEGWQLKNVVSGTVFNHNISRYELKNYFKLNKRSSDPFFDLW